MASLEAAIDEEMREAKNVSQDRRADSPSRRAQSAGPGISQIRSRLDSAEDSQRRSSSRGSTGIPFAMPSSARRLKPEPANKLDGLPSIEAQAMSRRAFQGANIDPSAMPRAMSSVYGDSAGYLPSPNDRSKTRSPTSPFDRSASGSPAPRRSSSPAMRTQSPHAFSPALPSPQSPDRFKGTAPASGGGVRLTMDDDGDESVGVDSSNNNSDSSDWDDGWTPDKKKERGRQRERKGSGATDNMGREIITAKSLLATAAAQRAYIHVSTCA